MAPDREETIAELTRRFEERLRQDWPNEQADITQIEDIVSRIEREGLREVTDAMVREHTGKRAGNQAACRCGGNATYRKQASIDLVTAHGRVRAERAYFYCPRCRDGFCPQDHAWGIGAGHSTPTTQSIVGFLAAEGAYSGVPKVLRRVRPQIHLGTKTVELIAQCLGKQVQAAPPRLSGPATRALAVAVDGTIIPMRGQGKEVRCGVIYEPEWEAGRTPEAEMGLCKEFFATLESRDELVRTVCAQVERRRPTPETRVSALGDGAPWIWTGYARYLPNRVEVLDFYHVGEHLSVVAAAWYGEGTAAARLWVARMKGDLKGGGPEGLLRSMRAWKPKTKEAAKVKRRELEYFRKNRERMNYPSYISQGLPIGSGVVEGACKHVVGRRFKGSGMRWNQKTAEPLLHLRAALLSKPDLDLRDYVPRHMLA